jgi:hypothetical protein
MSNERTYWGILCRSCAEPVAFGIRPYYASGQGIAHLRSGAICCAHGHNHIYFLRDFRFVSSAAAITEATMQVNREAYQAINPTSEGSFEGPGPSIANEKAFDVAKAMAKGRTAQPSSVSPDPRREAARIAANSRWADWAMKKAL